MENVLLIVHLIIAVFLIGVVLLQRSEGGALGIGGGGGGGLVSGRGAATALSKVTWFLAAAFITTSLLLTVLAAQKAGSRSVVEGAAIDGGAVELPAAEAIDDDLKGLIAPLPGADPAPVDDPATPPAAN